MSLRGGPEFKARLRAARLMFKTAGRDWADATARAARPMIPTRTGETRRSVRRKNATQRKATVVARYVAYFIDAGPKPHTITAKRGRMLRFEANGNTVFARRVHHRGYRARPFRARAAHEGLRRAPLSKSLIDAWNGAA